MANSKWHPEGVCGHIGCDCYEGASADEINRTWNRERLLRDARNEAMGRRESVGTGNKWIVTRAELRALVDAVHSYCYEDESVPSTATADGLIDKWRDGCGVSTFPDASRATRATRARNTHARDAVEVKEHPLTIRCVVGRHSHCVLVEADGKCRTYDGLEDQEHVLAFLHGIWLEHKERAKPWKLRPMLK